VRSENASEFVVAVLQPSYSHPMPLRLSSSSAAAPTVLPTETQTQPAADIMNDLATTNPAMAQQLLLLQQLQQQQQMQMPMDNVQQFLLNAQLLQQQQQLNLMAALGRGGNGNNPPNNMFGNVEALQQLMQQNQYNNLLVMAAQRNSAMGAAAGNMGMNMGLGATGFYPGGLNVASMGPSPSMTGSGSTTTTAPARPVQQPQMVIPLGVSTPLPAALAQPDDNLKLSGQQVFLRNQIEAFRAREDDILTHTRGRNKPIVLNQVGIRCKFCAHLPVARRQKGSTYFPASLNGLYQAAQNMNTSHMSSGLCTEMPVAVKQEFANLIATREQASAAGRPYWANAAAALGLMDTEDGIRHVDDVLDRSNIAAPAAIAPAVAPAAAPETTTDAKAEDVVTQAEI
jgi:hypothetical protein